MGLFEVGIILLVGLCAFFSFNAGKIKGTIHTLCFLKDGNCLKPLESLTGTEVWPEALKKMYDNPREYL